MARRRRRSPKDQAPTTSPAPSETPPPKQRPDALGLVTLGTVIAVLLISFWNWRAIDQIQTALDEKLSEIEGKIGQGSNRAADQPTRRGLDPDRVYSIQIARAPVRGPANAPVTIAEFSDFE